MTKRIKYEKPWLLECLFAPDGTAHFSQFSKYTDRIRKIGGTDELYSHIRKPEWSDLVRDGVEYARGPGTDSVRTSLTHRHPNAVVWYRQPTPNHIFGSTFADWSEP